MSDLDPKIYMHRPVWVTHNSFIEGSHMAKNMGSGHTGAKQNKRMVEQLSRVIKSSVPPTNWFLQKRLISFLAKNK